MASNAVSRALGYAENGFGSLAPEGVARDDPALPDDRRGVAVAAAAAGRRSRVSTPAATCSGPDEARSAARLEPAAGAAPAAAGPAAPEAAATAPPDDAGEFPIVPSADIIPPMSGMPESENMLPPLPAAAPRSRTASPLDVWYQAGK